MNAVSDTSASSVVINADTFEIIYSNSADTKRSMASTTKIMTGLLLAESGRLDEIIECTAEMVTVEGSAMGLRAGDRISGRDLLYGLMLMSGNDAANVTAYFLSGSVSEFAKLMNEKARELGLASTNFVTPSGLDADEHYTTAYDLACLTAYALKNEEFKKACSSYTATVSFGNPMQKRTITNHNRLLKSYEDCIGVKTGFTKKSGRCLVSAAERDGKTVIAVTLNDPNDWRDHASMLDFGLEALTVRVFTSYGVSLDARVLGGTTDKISLNFDDMTVYTTENNADKLRIKLDIPEYVIAPVNMNDKIGTASILCGEHIVKTTDIYATEESAEIIIPPKTYKEKVYDFLITMLKSF